MENLAKYYVEERSFLNKVTTDDRLAVARGMKKDGFSLKEIEGITQIDLGDLESIFQAERCG